MKPLNLSEQLRSNPYPGRGIVLGHTVDNKSAVIAYFIMGRSENSRNRSSPSLRMASGPRHMILPSWRILL